MCRTNLPHSLWSYALMTTARIINLVPTIKGRQNPYEIWHRHKPNLSYLRVWEWDVDVTNDSKDKLDSRVEKVFSLDTVTKVDYLSTILMQTLFLFKWQDTSSKKKLLIEELKKILWISKKYENHKLPLTKLESKMHQILLQMNQTRTQVFTELAGLVRYMKYIFRILKVLKFW